MQTPAVHLLARAVIEHEDHFLLARAHGTSNSFLPGGHIEYGEGIPNCLRRELLEECGLNVNVGRFLGIVEHGWADAHGRRQVEINHLFLVSSPALTRDQSVASIEADLSFEWVHVSQLEVKALKPPPLIDLLTRMDLSSAWYASSLKTQP